MRRYALVGLLFSSGAATVAPGSGPLDRAGLVALMDRYLLAVASHDPASGWE